jgi:adenosylhomocysteine nucleosidase
MSDTAVIMTATDIEYNAVLRHLDDVELHRHEAGTRFEVGTLRGTAFRIALVLSTVGNRASAVIAERAIQEFAPPALLFCGIAGSLWDRPGIGDIVVAERVYAYQGGTSEHDGLKARPRAWEAPHQVSQTAHALNRSGDWRSRLPVNAGNPEVRFGAVAAGEVLKNSDRSLEAKFIRQHYNDAIAIEMEAAGVAEAGHLNNTMVGIVRGISDMSDGSKNTKSDAQSQPRAAAHAAAFAVALAQALINDREDYVVAKRDNEPAPTGPNMVHNYSSAATGIQAGQINATHVSVNLTPTAERPDDLPTAIIELREQLEHALTAGEVDGELYSAAIEEIDTAEAALREPNPKSRKKAVLAMKRLGGLVGDLTGFATRVSLVIAGVNGLS